MTDRKTCFIISTIGEKDSLERKNADEKFDLVFEPILKEFDYDVTRADKVGTPGSISYDIVQRIINSDLIIADVSDLNPNVFYELAIRNAVNKPVIVIKGTNQKMPFDIYDKRAISMDMTQARLWTESKEQLKTQIVESEKDKDIASQSILSTFSFQIDPNKKLSPETELGLSIKDIKEEIKLLRTEMSETQGLSRREISMKNLYKSIQEERSSQVAIILDSKTYATGDDITVNLRYANLLTQEPIKVKILDPDSTIIFLKELRIDSSTGQTSFIIPRINWRKAGNYTAIANASSGLGGVEVFVYLTRED